MAIRIRAAEPLPNFIIRLTWANGVVNTVDLADVIADNPIYAPIKDDPALFGTVTVGEWGYDLHWTDDMEIPCTWLWDRAQAQAA